MDEVTSQNEIIVILGASATYEEEDLEKLKEALSGCEYLLLQMEINREATERLISMAYDMGIRVIFKSGTGTAAFRRVIF